jgi:hypothetical protein
VVLADAVLADAVLGTVPGLQRIIPLVIVREYGRKRPYAALRPGHMPRSALPPRGVRIT